MDISSALNRIEVVLNQYHAFQEIKEALEAAVHAEQAVVECDLKVKALRQEIGDLEEKREEYKLYIAADLDQAKLDLDKMAKEQAEVFTDYQIKIGAAHKELAQIMEAIEQARKDFDAEVANKTDFLNQIREKAAAEMVRYEAAKKALEDIKANL